MNKISCVSLIFLVSVASAQAQWRRLGSNNQYNYLDTVTDQSYEAYRWTNITGSSQLHTQTGSYGYVQKVVGSDDTGPSWSAKFNPKSDSGTSLKIDWSISETVPAGKIVGVNVKFSTVEDGKETWYFSPVEVDPENEELLPSFEQRLRTWYTPDSPSYTVYRNW